MHERQPPCRNLDSIRVQTNNPQTNYKRAAHGAELVAFDVAAESMEGTAPGAQTVIIKFESTEAAKGWYNSAEYQAVVGKRLEATTGYAVISQSMNAGG